MNLEVQEALVLTGTLLMRLFPFGKVAGEITVVVENSIDVTSVICIMHNLSISGSSTS